MQELENTVQVNSRVTLDWLILKPLETLKARFSFSRRPLKISKSNPNCPPVLPLYVIGSVGWSGFIKQLMGMRICLGLSCLEVSCSLVTPSHRSPHVMEIKWWTTMRMWSFILTRSLRVLEHGDDTSMSSRSNSQRSCHKEFLSRWNRWIDRSYFHVTRNSCHVTPVVVIAQEEFAMAQLIVGGLKRFHLPANFL